MLDKAAQRCHDAMKGLTPCLAGSRPLRIPEDYGIETRGRVDLGSGLVESVTCFV